MPAAMLLAEMSGLNAEETNLLEIAAAFHDIGFLVRRQEHELISVDFTAQVLPGFGFTSDEISTIQRLIMATRLPNQVHTSLEGIMVDADLDTLGKNNFFIRSNDLRNELFAYDIKFTDEQWYIAQLKFLEEHKYFSRAAQTLRDAGKQKNITEMKRRLADVKGKD